MPSLHHLESSHGHRPTASLLTPSSARPAQQFVKQNDQSRLSSTGWRRKRPVSVGCGVSLRAPILSRHDRHPAPGARADTGVCATRRLNRSPRPGHPWSRCRLPAAGAMPRCRALRQGRPRRPWRRRTAPLRGIATTTGTGAYLAPRHRSRLASRRTLDRSSPARIAKHGTRARLPAPIPRALAGAVLHVALVGAVEHRLLSAIRTSTGTSTYRSTCTSTGSSGTSLTRISASARRRLVSPPVIVPLCGDG